MLVGGKLKAQLKSKNRNFVVLIAVYATNCPLAVTLEVRPAHF